MKNANLTWGMLKSFVEGLTPSKFDEFKDTNVFIWDDGERRLLQPVIDDSMDECIELNLCQDDPITPPDPKKPAVVYQYSEDVHSENDGFFSIFADGKEIGLMENEQDAIDFICMKKSK